MACRAISSLRATLAARYRPSSTSEDTTALPKSSSTRWYRRSSGGINFAAIDGPGQGSTLYDQRLPMRPDWEAVVPGMVDRLMDIPQVDLIGSSSSADHSGA